MLMLKRPMNKSNLKIVLVDWGDQYQVIGIRCVIFRFRCEIGRIALTLGKARDNEQS